jgi:hypothetical protein
VISSARRPAEQAVDGALEDPPADQGPHDPLDEGLLQPYPMMNTVLQDVRPIDGESGIQSALVELLLQLRLLDEFACAAVKTSLKTV